ncbi:MAG TPA: hypothetical protein VHM70_22345 [Polyangiaceae bacterium]|nr:hypothetical protein [Polyangiaceae bacterium]
MRSSLKGGQVVGVPLAVVCFASMAGAEPTKFEFDSLSEITDAGFVHNSSGGTSSVANGVLTITTDTYEEWILDQGYGDWWQSGRASGWVVEAKIRFLSEDTACRATGFWATGSDGAIVQFKLNAGWAGIDYPQTVGLAMDTTDDFHVYRVQYLGRARYNLIVDGVLVADVHQLDTGGGSQILSFGNLGGCNRANSEWDYFMYDPAPAAVLEGDADGDGVSNADDNCSTLANADQADEDQDGDGDSCDSCPKDSANDADADNLCADVDACPDDPRNDQDMDGACDTAECKPFEDALAVCAPATTCQRDPNCPAICQCEPPFVGRDPALPPLDNCLIRPTPTPSATVPPLSDPIDAVPTSSAPTPAPSGIDNAETNPAPTATNTTPNGDDDPTPTASDQSGPGDATTDPTNSPKPTPVTKPGASSTDMQAGAQPASDAGTSEMTDDMGASPKANNDAEASGCAYPGSTPRGGWTRHSWLGLVGLFGLGRLRQRRHAGAASSRGSE